jgi:hypothetical protein
VIRNSTELGSRPAAEPDRSIAQVHVATRRAVSVIPSLPRCYRSEVGAGSELSQQESEPNNVFDPSADLPSETPLTNVRLPTRIANALSKMRTS